MHLCVKFNQNPSSSFGGNVLKSLHRQMDRQTDEVKPIYPLNFSFREYNDNRACHIMSKIILKIVSFKSHNP